MRVPASRTWKAPDLYRDSEFKGVYGLHFYAADPLNVTPAEISIVNLVAAVPEMYEALNNLVVFLQENGLDKTPSGGVGAFAYEGTEYEEVSNALHALAKAEGKNR